MRIAVFTDTYLPTVDGVVTSLLTTKRELERQGHEVVVFAPQAPGNGTGRHGDVVWVPAKEFRAYPGYRVALRPAKEADWVADVDPDVIHSHGVGPMGFKGMWAAKLTGRPLVLTFHTMVTDALTYYTPFHLDLRLLDRGLRLYLRVFLHRCRAVVVPTRAILREIEALAPRMQLTDVIPTGVDTARFRPHGDGSAVRAKWGLGGDDVVLHVGRLAYEKNLPLLLEAFRRLREDRPRAKLVFVGQGPCADDLRTRVRAAGLEPDVRFAGFVPDEDLPAYYAACDVLAIASTFETQGLVVLEAMAAGKPVAGANFRAIPEFVRNGVNGYLFPPNDAAEAARAIGRCLDERDALGVRARKTAEAFTVEASTRRLVQMYERLRQMYPKPAR